MNLPNDNDIENLSEEALDLNHDFQKGFSSLSSEEQERMLEYNQSLAQLERAQGKQILFERAPEETIPFIAYCVFVSANALIATILLITQQKGVLPYYLLIAGAMILPLFALPSGSFRATISWAKSWFRGAV